jgi:hypothetical protein
LIKGKEGEEESGEGGGEERTEAEEKREGEEERGMEGKERWTTKEVRERKRVEKEGVMYNGCEGRVEVYEEFPQRRSQGKRETQSESVRRVRAGMRFQIQVLCPVRGATLQQAIKYIRTYHESFQ